MHQDTPEITALIEQAAARARRETDAEPEDAYVRRAEWPIACTVGPGLEGAIACHSAVGYVNGSKGWLIYRGYDIFDLCAHCCFEEVTYLLLHGRLPTAAEFRSFTAVLARHANVPLTERRLMSFDVENMHPMAALRLGTNLMRQEFTALDREAGEPDPATAISTDEDSIPMETPPRGGARAVYERGGEPERRGGTGLASCLHLIAGVASIAGAVARLRAGRLPLEPDPELGFAARLLCMMTGRRPSAEEARIMDVALILHADHGMNASTFAAMVVASTLADNYFSVGAGIAALSGPLHGGANEEALRALESIGAPGRVRAWLAAARRRKAKVPGFGHRVYKSYDPRARVLGPLARRAASARPELRPLLATAAELERQVARTLGREKKVFPNVDFYSGLVYRALGIPTEMFTPVFAVSRVAGWTARILEYMKHNRIFRPRALYVGEMDRRVTPMARRRPPRG